jgi:hypothetical protein
MNEKTRSLIQWLERTQKKQDPKAEAAPGPKVGCVPTKGTQVLHCKHTYYVPNAFMKVCLARHGGYTPVITALKRLK